LFGDIITPNASGEMIGLTLAKRETDIELDKMLSLVLVPRILNFMALALFSLLAWCPLGRKPWP